MPSNKSLHPSLVVRRHMKANLDNPGFVVLLLGGLLLVSSEALGCGDRPVYAVERQDGISYGLFLSDAEVEKMSDWQPGDGAPPLSIADAVASSEKWGVQHFTKYEGVQISGIQMLWARCSPSQAKWYYLFEVTPEFDGHLVRSATRSVAVLLDGTVIALKEVRIPERDQNAA